MHHAVRATVRSFAPCLLLATLALAGCATEAEPGPAPSAATEAPAPAVTDGRDGPSDPAGEAAIYQAPGELTVRWAFAESDLATACASRGVASVRLEVGLDAPAVVDCAAGARRYPGLPAGMYSVGVVMLDAAGAVVAERYEAVLLRSGASEEVRAAF